MAAPGVYHRQVSILVFLELAPGLEAAVQADLYLPMFQSLFFWNSRPDMNALLA